MFGLGSRTSFVVGLVCGMVIATIAPWSNCLERISDRPTATSPRYGPVAVAYKTAHGVSDTGLVASDGAVGADSVNADSTAAPRLGAVKSPPRSASKASPSRAPPPPPPPPPAAPRLSPPPPAHNLLPPLRQWKPRGCPSECSGRGTCNLDTGICLCETGASGADCSVTERPRCNLPSGDELVSRCAGRCGVGLHCFCGGGRFPNRSLHRCEFKGIGKWTRWRQEGWNYGQVAPSPRAYWSRPEDAPMWVRNHSSLREAGRRGEVAWCDADPAKGERPMRNCACHEGQRGEWCEHPVLMTCLNQCSGFGVCEFGYCRCEPGRYGVDCSLKEGRVELLLNDSAKGASLAPQPQPQPPQPKAKAAAGTPRLRPLVYVYELPIEFNVGLWTTKYEDKDCTLRAYSSGWSNRTTWHMHAHGMEIAVHEALLSSPHRTADPSEADFFMVPAWGGCWLSRFSRPTPQHHDLTHLRMIYPELRKPRAARASQQYRLAYEYVSRTFPYWNRSGGRDHIWTFPHDEGACLAPVEIANAIFVTHWGRLDRPPGNHTTISQGQGWHEFPYFKNMYGSEKCFDIKKDVLLPIYKSRPFVETSPFLTGRQPKRTRLFNFLGNALRQPPEYSMGLRQQLHHLFVDHPDNCAKRDVQGCVLVGGHTRSFIDELQRSVFCGVLPGNGWGHIEEPVIQGCIPVLVMPNIAVQLEHVLNISRFSIRISRDQLPRLVDMLRAIPQRRVAEMQAELAKVWERYTYSSIYKREFRLQIHASGPGRERILEQVGRPPPAQELPRSFGAVESRLTGVDAVVSFLDVLWRRRNARSEQLPLVDHGAPRSLPPVLAAFNPITKGVQ